MGFMNSYKRLENLCRDMNGVGLCYKVTQSPERIKRLFCITGEAALGEG